MLAKFGVLLAKLGVLFFQFSDPSQIKLFFGRFHRPLRIWLLVLLSDTRGHQPESEKSRKRCLLIRTERVLYELNWKVGVLPPSVLPGQADITGPNGPERLHILKISDPEMQAKLRIEQARCYRDAERFTEAYAILTEASLKLTPGRGAREAACDLADVCLRIGRPDQAVVVAGRALKSSPAGSHRKRARKLLAAAYLARQEYENAATVLSNMPIDEPGVKQQ